MNRVLQLDKGVALFISDIQGNREDFDQALFLYQLLKKNKACDYFVICGDLIHGYPGYPDDSFSLLKQVMKLKESDPGIILLLGNHELAHIVHWGLQKGFISFTDTFEENLKEDRAVYWEFLNSLPFALYTSGGLMVNHTGTSAAMAGEKSEDWDLLLSITPPHLWYQNFDFEKEFKIKQEQKDQFDGPFGQKIQESPMGKLLWEVFMNKNEYAYRKKHDRIVEGFHENMSKIAPFDVLISSHIEEKEGYKVVHDRHFRLCTSYGARDQQSKKYLLLDVAAKIESAQQLVPQLRNLW